MKSLDDLKIKYLIESRMQMTNSENDILVTADQYYWGYCIYFKFKDHKFKHDFLKFFKLIDHPKVDGTCCLIGVTQQNLTFKRFFPAKYEDTYCRKNNISPYFVYQIFEIPIEDLNKYKCEITNECNYKFS